MKTKTLITRIQKKLPNDIIIFDETNFEFTDDEYIGILSWIKYFNYHYEAYHKDKYPDIVLPLISKRLRLDFGLYRFPSNTEGENKGKHLIYLSNNYKATFSGKIEKQTVNELISTWKL